jgi:hypothetical protein
MLYFVLFALLCASHERLACASGFARVAEAFNADRNVAAPLLYFVTAASR